MELLIPINDNTYRKMEMITNRRRIVIVRERTGYSLSITAPGSYRCFIYPEKKYEELVSDLEKLCGSKVDVTYSL